MGFDNPHPNRKDHRAPYQKKPQRLDHTCRPGGSCPWCASNRGIGTVRRLLAATLTPRAFFPPGEEPEDDGRGMDFDDATGQY